MKPYFELDGQKYEFVCTRHLQVFWDDLMQEIKNDKEYQRKKVDYESKKSTMQSLTEKYMQARESYFSDPLDEGKERLYLKLKGIYDQELKEYTDYIVEDDFAERDSKRMLDSCEKLMIEALKEQHTAGDGAKAADIWERYVESVENRMSASELLVYMANDWFGEASGETDNQYLKKAKGRARS